MIVNGEIGVVFLCRRSLALPFQGRSCPTRSQYPLLSGAAQGHKSFQRSPSMPRPGLTLRGRLSRQSMDGIESPRLHPVECVLAGMPQQIFRKVGDESQSIPDSSKTECGVTAADCGRDNRRCLFQNLTTGTTHPSM